MSVTSVPPCLRANLFIWLFLLGAAFLLYAQNDKIATIYVPQVSGNGSKPGDNAAFTDILIRELKYRNIAVKETQEDADYAIIGTLSPSGPNPANFMLSLAMQDKNGLILYEQTLFYKTVEEANAYLPTILLNMLSSIFTIQVVVPEEHGADVENPVVQQEQTEIIYIGRPPEEAPARLPEDAWRNSQWYIGANVFWNPRIYYGTQTEFFNANFGWGLSVDFNLQKYGYGEMLYLKYLAVGTGIEFTSEWVVATAKNNDEYRNTIMQVPLTIYGVFKPGRIHLLQPYLGLVFNIPFLPDTVPPLLSWKVGFQYGTKAGKNSMVYGDIRYSMDFSKSGLNADNPNDNRQYDRFMFYLGAGYKHDLVEAATATADLFKKVVLDIKDHIDKAVAAKAAEKAAAKAAAEKAAEAEAAVETQAVNAAAEAEPEPAAEAEPAPEAESAPEAEPVPEA